MPTIDELINRITALEKQHQQDMNKARTEIRELAKEKDEQIAKLTQQLTESNNQLKESLANVSDRTKAAQTTADNGVNLANQVQQTANDGVNRANKAQQTANDGVNLANKAQQTANTALTKANTAEQLINTKVDSLRSDIQNGSTVAKKALMLRARDNNHWLRFRRVDPSNHDVFELWSMQDDQWFSTIRVQAADVLLARSEEYWMKHKGLSGNFDCYGLWRPNKGHWFNFIQVGRVGNLP